MSLIYIIAMTLCYNVVQLSLGISLPYNPGDIKTRVNILAKNPYFSPPPSEIPISSLFFTARFKRRVRNKPKNDQNGAQRQKFYLFLP